MVVYAHFLNYYSIIDYLIHLDCLEKKQIDILEKYEHTLDLL